LLDIRPEFVAANVEAADAVAVITLLAGRLHAHGVVAATYGAATLEREMEHPTGLPTNPFPIAIPHADADGVIKSSLAMASLKEPVLFKNMADPDEDLSVELVLLLANNNPEEQIQSLRNLSLVFGQPDKLTELRSLTSPDEIARWLDAELNTA
jgi:PTS system galactitol-specific IIA component